MAAADEDHDGDDARCGQNIIARPRQLNHIGVVLFECCEIENGSGEPDQDEADTFESLHEMAGGFAREDGTRPLPVSNLSRRRERVTAPARKLHKNPELLQTALLANALRRQIVRSAIRGDHQMLIPTKTSQRRMVAVRASRNGAGLQFSSPDR